MEYSASSSHVEVPQTVPLTDANLQRLPSLINPLRANHERGVDIYRDVLQYLL